MGKARILSAQGEGLYSIEILEDRTRAESRKTTAQQRITQIDSKISSLETDLSTAQGEVDSAAAAQNQAIDDYQAALADDQVDEAKARQAMIGAGEAIIQAAAKRDAIARNIAALKVERLTLQARIDQINALPPLRQQEAWCADYVEDLSGEVATAEVPGEIGQVIIKPGYSDSAAWSPADDGAIQPALSGTPASVFYNLAMLPGWQKWRPTFRIASISNIDNDLCDITLDPASSSQQGLNVNAQGSYSDVPIMYMDCNGGVFEAGDRVLVAFSGGTGQPMVVGFEQEPRACFFGAGEITAPRKYFGDTYVAYVTASDCSDGTCSFYTYSYQSGEDLEERRWYGINGSFASGPTGDGLTEGSETTESDNNENMSGKCDYRYTAKSSGSGGRIQFDATLEIDLSVTLDGESIFSCGMHKVESYNVGYSGYKYLGGGSYVFSLSRWHPNTPTSEIIVGNVTIDTLSMGVEIAGFSMLREDTNQETNWFTSRRYQSGIDNDTYALLYETKPSGIVYLDILFSASDSSDPYEEDSYGIYSVRFARTPDQGIFRIQSSPGWRRLPDDDSQPAGVVKDEDGNWIAE